jgi:hypothetical protein
MKKFFLAAMLPWLCLAFLQGQKSLPQKLHHLYAPLNKTDLQTGYLWDQSASFASPMDYKGVMESKSANIDIFGMLYGAMLQSNTQTTTILPKPSVYLDKIRQLGDNSPIPMAIMAMRFDRIYPDAVSRGLLKNDGQQMYDVSNRPSSPYFQDSFFVATPLRGTSNSMSPQFVFPQDLWFSNLGEKLPVISFDAGDDLGWQSITFGSPITAKYTKSGLKTLQIRLDYGGRIFYAVSGIEISEIAVAERSNGME